MRVIFPGKKYVLVVDDDEAVRHLLVRELHRTFITVLASDYAEAVLQLRVRRSELAAIVTDWQLGSGPSGIDLLELARCERFSCVRVIVSGDMNDDLQAHLASDELADAAFEKPWPPSAVATLVSELVAHAARQSPPR